MKTVNFISPKVLTRYIEPPAEGAALVFPRVPAWYDQARCKDHPNPDIFYPERGETSRAAVKVCNKCPVKMECRDHAVQNYEMHGVWGGLGTVGRRQVRKTMGTTRPAKRKATGLCANGHEWTPENTHIRPNGSPSCRQCNTEAKRRDRAGK